MSDVLYKHLSTEALAYLIAHAHSQVNNIEISHSLEIRAAWKRADFLNNFNTANVVTEEDISILKAKEVWSLHGELKVDDLFEDNSMNALYKALVLAAADYQLTIPHEEARNSETKAAVYQFLDESPIASMVSELLKSLNKIGWCIQPIKVIIEPKERSQEDREEDDELHK